jgi:hypothetical protein
MREMTLIVSDEIIETAILSGIVDNQFEYCNSDFEEFPVVDLKCKIQILFCPKT